MIGMQQWKRWSVGSAVVVMTAWAVIRVGADETAPTAYLMKARLVRYHIDRSQQITETVVMSPSILDLDKSPAKMEVASKNSDDASKNSGYAVLLTPRQNADKTVTLTAEVRELGPKGKTLHSGKNRQIVALGAATRVVGMTDARDNTLIRAAQKGEVVTDRGSYDGYYLEVTTTLSSPGAASK